MYSMKHCTVIVHGRRVIPRPTRCRTLGRAAAGRGPGGLGDDVLGFTGDKTKPSGAGERDNLYRSGCSTHHEETVCRPSTVLCRSHIHDCTGCRQVPPPNAIRSSSIHVHEYGAG